MGSKRSRSRKSIFKDFGEENSYNSMASFKNNRPDIKRSHTARNDLEEQGLKKSSSFKPISLDLQG